MFLKIYIQNKPLYLCDALDDTLNSLVHFPDTIFMDELNNHTVKTIIREMQLPEIRSGVFIHEDLQQLKKAVFKKFELIPAGGGLVQNERKEILMIFRRGFWDLPKGKLDKGETLEQCAVREVSEETGLKTIRLKKKLLVTYHNYLAGGRQMLKESHWFAMSGRYAEKLTAQTEEDITQIKWVSRKELPIYARLSYPSIVDVLNLLRPVPKKSAPRK